MLKINIGLKRESKMGFMRAALFVVCALFLAPKSFGFADIRPLALNESFGSAQTGGTYFNIDTSWLHWRSDGKRAYCRQRGLKNPDGTEGYYTLNAWEGWEANKIRAIFYHAPSIAAANGFSTDQQRALTQVAIWAIETSNDIGGYGGGAVNAASVNSGDTSMLAAFQELYALAEAGDMGPQIASVHGLTGGGKLTPGAFSSSFVRYGPFSAVGLTTNASFTAAPAGSYFGDSSGKSVAQGSIPSGKQLYLYVPTTADSPANAQITATAGIKETEVTKYSGFAGYQDQFVHTGTRDVQVTQSEGIYGFGKAQIRKIDAASPDSSLSGASFAIDEWNDRGWQATEVPIYWDNETRTYTTGLLFETESNCGRFRIRETGAPYGYLPGWSGEVSIAGRCGKIVFISAENTQVQLTVSAQKRDLGTGAPTPQGDASLARALYGLYMDETRVLPDGTTLTKDEKMAEAWTNSEGVLTIEGLFPACYYLKEISAPEGYELDESKYHIDGTAIPAGVATFEANYALYDEVKKQAFELIKGGNMTDETEMELLEAGFSIYLVSELSKVKDGTLAPANATWTARDFRGYDFLNETPCSIDGTPTNEFFTNSLGFLRSPELPYGTYVVAETTVPDGRTPIYPFIVRITDSGAPQPWRLFNDEQESHYIKISKRDAGTGTPVQNNPAAYRIFDMDKGEYITMKATYPTPATVGTEQNPFLTDMDGTLITPQKLKWGHYRLDEVKAPRSYVLAGYENPLARTAAPAVLIDFDENAPVYLADAEESAIEISQFNMAQSARIELSLSGKPIPVTTDENTQAGSENIPLANATFEVVANGDILAPDGSGNILYSSGEVVAILTTDQNGYAETLDLPLGDYILRQTAAPEGYEAACDQTFTAAPQDETKTTALISFALTNELAQTPTDEEPEDPALASPEAAEKTTNSSQKSDTNFQSSESASPAATQSSSHSPQTNDTFALYLTIFGLIISTILCLALTFRILRF